MLAKRWLYPLTFLAFAPVLCATPPAPTPAPPAVAIIFPDVKPPAPPQPPPPQPGTVPTLAAGVIYPVECRVDCVFRAYPANLVTIRTEVIPAGETLRMPGNFIDGKKSHRWKGPCTVYLVEAAPAEEGKPAKAGRCELVAVPIGLKSEKDIITRPVDVNGPAPTPDPVDPVIPEPKPKPPEPAKTFHVIFVVESGKGLTPAQDGVINGTMVEAYLTKTCTGGKDGWRRRDPDSPAGAGVMGEIWTAAKQAMKPGDVPCVIVEKNSKVEIIPVEPTPEAMIAKFNEYVKGAR